jgi:DNA-binding CsgD family transcriptional regulator
LSTGLILVLATVVLSLVLGWLVDEFIVRLLLDQAATRAADEVQLGLLDRVTLADFATPEAADHLDDLAQRLDPVIARLRNDTSSILRVNVIGHDGTILYSDLGAARGRRIPLADRHELEAALGGGTGSDETVLDGAENADLRADYDRALEVYVPVRIDGTVAGAYEIYEDIGQLRLARSLVWGALLGSWCLVGVGAMWVRRRARPDVRARRVDVLASEPAAPDSQPTMQANAARDRRVRLTPREVEVLRLMATSHSNRDIAEQLGVSQETVRTHVKRILHKLEQPDRTQAVVEALRQGLLDLS